MKNNNKKKLKNFRFVFIPTIFNLKYIFFNYKIN